jgi:hypothetical protein
MTLVSFTPPTRNESSDDRFWGRFGMPTGISVVWNGTAFAQSPIPWLGEIAALEVNPLTGISEGYRWFRGGCTYQVDDDTAALLTSAGFEVG